MTECKEIQDRLFGYISGEIPDVDAQRVTSHLEHCHECQKVYQDMSWMHRQLREHREILQETCPEPDILIDFSEGRLSPGEEESIRRHLSVCPACRKSVEALKTLESLPEEIPGSGAEEAEPPLPFIQEVRRVYPRDVVPESGRDHSILKLLWFGLGSLAVGVAVIILVFSHVADRGKALFLSGGVALQSPLHVYGEAQGQKRLGILIFLDPKLGLSKEAEATIRDAVNHAMTGAKGYRIISRDTVREILGDMTSGRIKKAEKMLVRSGRADAWLFVELKKGKHIQIKIRLVGASGEKIKEVTKDVSSPGKLPETLKAALLEVR